MRPVVSYDDITDLTGGAERKLQGSQAPQLGPHLPSTHQPPTKRRRTNHNANKRSQNKQQDQLSHAGGRQQQPKQFVQHWDEPGTSNLNVNYGGEGSEFVENEGEHDTTDFGNEVEYDVGEGDYGGADAMEEDEEESRDLTHDEIWDDHALIEAWDSACAEYEAYHGKDKKWKAEPVKKSPLWYNVPLDPPKESKPQRLSSTTKVDQTVRHIPITQVTNEDGMNSKPFDFDTFIPTHDPSLAPHPSLHSGAGYIQTGLPSFQGPIVTQDEAFHNALSAMYWSGYWTAVYHHRRQTQQEVVQPGEAGDEEGGGGDDDDGEVEDGEEDEDEEDFVPAQR